MPETARPPGPAETRTSHADTRSRESCGAVTRDQTRAALITEVPDPSTAALRRIAAMVRRERDRAERRLAPFRYRDWLDELLALTDRPTGASSGDCRTEPGPL